MSEYPVPAPHEVSVDMNAGMTPNFADECIQSCPQLHQCAVAAVIRLAVEGGDLTELINREIIRKQGTDELPTHCELGPTTISSGDVRPGGTRVRLANLTASGFWGFDGWDNPVASVCQIDAEKLLHGHRLNAPWERDDFRTRLFDNDIKREFLQSEQ